MEVHDEFKNTQNIFLFIYFIIKSIADIKKV